MKFTVAAKFSQRECALEAFSKIGSVEGALGSGAYCCFRREFREFRLSSASSTISSYPKTRTIM